MKTKSRNVNMSESAKAVHCETTLTEAILRLTTPNPRITIVPTHLASTQLQLQQSSINIPPLSILNHTIGLFIYLHIPPLMSSTKRCRRPSSSSPEPFESAPKRHRPNRTTPILRLSDELFLRICFNLPICDLASFQLVSHRCSRIAVDGQIWKALYYQQFVLPRALRIRGLVRGQLGDYSSRRSRWLGEEGIAREVGTNWKALYKLRHNWARGSCGVRGIDVAGEVGKVGESDEEGLLVKLFDVCRRCLWIGWMISCEGWVRGRRAYSLLGNRIHRVIGTWSSSLAALQHRQVYCADTTLLQFSTVLMRRSTNRAGSR